MVLNSHGRWQPSASQSIHTIAQALTQTGRRSVASIRRQLEEDIEIALVQGISDTTLKWLGHAVHVVHDVSPPPRGYSQVSPQSVPPFSLEPPSGSNAEERSTPPTVSHAADLLPTAASQQTERCDTQDARTIVGGLLCLPCDPGPSQAVDEDGSGDHPPTEACASADAATQRVGQDASDTGTFDVMQHTNGS